MIIVTLYGNNLINSASSIPQLDNYIKVVRKMFQAVLDINLQTSNGSSKNWVMSSNLVADLDTLEKQVDVAIKNCKRSYNNLPLCVITVIIFDISNKIITHYEDINIKQYAYNDSVMVTAKLANKTATKKDYSTLFTMYEYALNEMQKNDTKSISLLDVLYNGR